MALGDRSEGKRARDSLSGRSRRIAVAIRREGADKMAELRFSAVGSPMPYPLLTSAGVGQRRTPTVPQRVPGFLQIQISAVQIVSAQPMSALVQSTG